MNEKERQVLALIKKNPYYAQQEMADILQISRPALANIISSLIKQGEIIGRGYVLKDSNEIIAVGGANVDRKFHIFGEAKLATSNPASVTYSVGGVARNIAENLGRLQVNVQMVTTLGDDFDREIILKDSQSYMKFDYAETIPHGSTGSYTAVLNEQGELVIAMADMGIYESLTPKLLRKNEAVFKKAKLIILDLNCPKETVEYFKALSQANYIPLCIVPVSVPKMNRLTDDLNGVTYFICNREEAEHYLNMEISTVGDYEKACLAFQKLGVQNIVITKGSDGVVAASQQAPKHFKALPVEHIKDVTGAGDAFVSAFLYGMLEDESFEKAITMGLFNASRTLESDYTVRHEITADQFKQL